MTTHPAFYAISNCTGLSYTSENKYNEFRYAGDGKTCIIGNDVWIGNNAIIMAGVIIGDGAIVGAGAVVTKNVEPYSIVVGVPATVLKYRFSQEEIQQLISIKWWDKDDNWIARNAKYFENVVDFIEKSY